MNFKDTEWQDEDEDTRNRVQALCQHLVIDPDEVNQGYDSTTFEEGKREYMVLTDDETDEKQDESLDSYIDDCKIPESIRPYFDEDKWKKDARMDGRGHCLSGHDGEENEEEVDGETFYIYRIN